jgi:hypothetical protein
MRPTHIVTAVFGSQSIMPSVLEEARRPGADLAAIATEHARRSPHAAATRIHKHLDELDVEASKWTHGPSVLFPWACP